MIIYASMGSYTIVKLRKSWLSSVGLAMDHRKSCLSSVGLAMDHRKSCLSSVGLAMDHRESRLSYVGLAMDHRKSCNHKRYRCRALAQGLNFHCISAEHIRNLYLVKSCTLPESQILRPQTCLVLFASKHAAS